MMPRALPVLLTLLLVVVTVPGASAAGVGDPATAANPVGSSSIDAERTGIALQQSLSAQTNTSTNESDRPAISGLAFFTTYSADAAPPFRVGFSTNEAASGFFVLETAEGEIVGKTDYQIFSGGLAMDGLPVPLTEPVHGVVNMTVTAYNDSDGDRMFDPEVDEPYRYADGDPVASSMWFVVPNRDGNITGSGVTLDPAGPDATARHQFVLTAESDMIINSVAVDYRYTGIDLAGLDNASAGVGEIYPDKSTARLDAARVEKPMTGVAVLYPEQPLQLRAGEEFFVNLAGLTNPTEATNVTVLANPYGNGSTTTMTLDIQPPSPRISPQGVVGDQTRIGVYDPEGARGFIVAKDVDGAVIGTLELDPNREQHMDIVIGSFVDDSAEENGMTVELVAYIDSNGNGAFDPEVDEPYRNDGEPVTAMVEDAVFEVGTTTSDSGTTTTSDSGTTTTSDSGTTTTSESSTTDTPTTTPGFGVLIAVVGLLGAAVWVPKR